MKNWFIQATINVGRALIFGIILQFYFILFTFRGFILGGFFPALAASFKIIMRRLDKDNGYTLETPPRALFVEFKEFYTGSFHEINKIGYLSLPPMLILVADLTINSHLIKSFPVQIVLLLLLLLYTDFLLYLFPVFVRYNLDLRHYFKQALLLAVMNPKSLLLVTLTLVVLSLIFVIFPAVALIIFIPLYLWPITSITLKTFQKVEAVSK